MQYSRDESGKLTPLPKQNIDTGMGLERLASVVQRVKGDFETDLFKPVIERACELTGIRYGDSANGDLSVRVISDHLRAGAFMIADGVLPSNDGPGYVLRRLIRRSVRYGRIIGIDRPFLTELLPTVYDIMSDPYHELIEHRPTIEQIISLEEEKFGRTLAQGIEILETELSRVRDGLKELPGDVAFLLYDTFGFPLELTEEISGEAGVTVTRADFDREMDRQKERARASSKQSSAVMSKSVYTELADRLGATQFDGYDTDAESATVEAIVVGGELVGSITAGTSARIILSRTPFYGERGGQVGDTGTLTADGVRFDVSDTTHPSGDLTVHEGILSVGGIKTGMTVEAAVDSGRRESIRSHHTGTHLLHEALCRVLGSHVRQAGSLVCDKFLRFDFNHFSPLSEGEIAEVERVVYSQALADLPVNTSEMDYAGARKRGIKALFEEKYGDRVRVLDIPGFSTELCGGTHVRSTGQVGLMKIIKDEGIGAGVRRIVAVCGMSSLDLFQSAASTIRALSETLGADADTLAVKAESLLDENKNLRRGNDALILANCLASVENCAAEAIRMDGIALIARSFKGASRDMLRRIGDRLKEIEPDSVLLLAGIDEGGVSLIGMASESAVAKGAHAGNIVREISSLMGGSGGGRPSLGQGGGKEASKLKMALAAAENMVRDQLKK